MDAPTKYEIAVMSATSRFSGESNDAAQPRGISNRDCLSVVEALSASGIYAVRALVSNSTFKNQRGTAKHIASLPDVTLVPVDYTCKHSVAAAVRGVQGLYMRATVYEPDALAFRGAGQLVADVCKEEGVEWVVCNTSLNEDALKTVFANPDSSSSAALSPNVNDHILSLGLRGMIVSPGIFMEVFSVAGMATLNNEGDVVVTVPSLTRDTWVPTTDLRDGWGSAILASFNTHFSPSTLPTIRSVPGHTRTYPSPRPDDPENAWVAVESVTSKLKWGKMLDVLEEEINKADQESGAWKERGGKRRRVIYERAEEEAGSEHLLAVWRLAPLTSDSTAKLKVPPPEYEGVHLGRDWRQFCRDVWVHQILDEE